MVLNPYFTQGTTSEQNLVQDLINEQLRTYGVEIFYLPRKYVDEKTVIREVVSSKFDLALPLEAYVDNYDEYSGAGNLLSKFGLQSQDEVRLVISRERFENYITPLIEDQSNIKLSTRPKTGDLIWFPLDDRLYEIKDIEYAKPYYQLQDLYTYELQCELFRIEDEVISTGVDDIDDNLVGDDGDGTTDDGISTIQGITQTLTLIGTGSTATAITGIVTEGCIRYITIGDRGGGYLTPPTVSISNTEGDKDYVARITGITTATGIATMSSGGVVTNIDMTDTGFGYVLTPTVTLSDPDLDSTGDYKFNEQVTGQTSGATGRVRTWSSSSNQLEIASVVGTFLIGEDVKGDESGATHALRTKDDMPDAEDSEGFAANQEIEDAADSILDFSEQNPFGIP